MSSSSRLLESAKYHNAALRGICVYSCPFVVEGLFFSNQPVGHGEDGRFARTRYNALVAGGFVS